MWKLTTVPASESATLCEQPSVDSVANHKIQNNERFLRRVLRFVFIYCRSCFPKNIVEATFRQVRYAFRRFQFFQLVNYFS